MSKQGELFVFEGPDGVGKSTLAGLFAEHLRGNGVKCRCLAFPGKDLGTLGELVYSLHHRPEQFGVETLGASALQVLHIAAHIDAIDNYIWPALQNGECVILDRYWWSTWVYGLVSGVKQASLDAMIRLEKVHWGRVRPSSVFLIDRSKPLGECGDLAQWRRLLQIYKELARKEARRYPVHQISNEGPVDDTAEEILDQVLRQVTNNPAGSAKSVRGLVGADSGSRQLNLGISDDNLVAAREPLAPEVFTRLAPAKPSIVFETYWRFAAERQAIFFRRLEGAPSPWTKDAILKRFKFTNAYRASDRVSQYLIRNVIYQGDQSSEEVFFRTLLFKIFNSIGTWELLEEQLGPITYADYDFRDYDRVLSQAIQSKKRIYSAAYIMPTGRHRFGWSRKHQNHLKILELMMTEKVASRLAECRRLRDAFELLLSYPMIGDFLAYQYVTDLNYSELTDFSEMEFVVPGPGARDGIRKCFDSLGALSEPDIVRWITEGQAEHIACFGIDLKSLWGRPLQLIDCQNLFCEVAKYARLAHPEVGGLGDRTRIKQRFRPNPEPIDYWYPPKWGLNDRVQAAKEAVGLQKALGQV